MKPKFPHAYSATVTRTGHAQATITAPPRPSLVGAPPPELHGDAGSWSPEHLLASALGLCLFVTFDSFAARENLAVLGWRDVTTGVLDKTSHGLAFERFTIEVELTVDAADVERARVLLDKASRYCVISKALQVPVKIEGHIWSHDERAHVVAAEPAEAQLAT